MHSRVREISDETKLRDQAHPIFSLKQGLLRVSHRLVVFLRKVLRITLFLMLLTTRALVHLRLCKDAGWIFVKQHLFNSVNLIVVLGDHQVVLKALLESASQSPLRLVHLLCLDILNDFKSCL